MHYLLIKTHTKTGLKYLCRHTGTEESCHAYMGSGKYWRQHLKEHGQEHNTEIIFQTEDMGEFAAVGLHYSNLYDIVASPKWANACSEVGSGCGAGELHPLYGKSQSAEAKTNQIKGQTGLKKSESTKQKISEARKRYLADHPEVVAKQTKNLGDYVVKGSGVVNPFRGCRHTKQARQKMSLKQLARGLGGDGNPFFGHQHTAETKAIISAHGKTRTGAKNAAAKHWRFIAPDGQVHEVIGQTRQFCFNHGLKWVTFEYALKHNSFPITRGANAGWRVDRLA